MFSHSSTPSTCTLQLRLCGSSLSYCRYVHVSGNRNDWPWIVIYMVLLFFLFFKIYDIRLALQNSALTAINKKNNNVYDDVVFPKNLFSFTVRQLRRVSAPCRCHPINSSNVSIRFSCDWAIQYFFFFVQQTVPCSDLSTQYGIDFYSPVRGGRTPGSCHKNIIIRSTRSSSVNVYIPLPST